MAETAANKVFIFSSTKVPGPAGRISASRKTVPPPQMAGIRPHFYASIARRASACPRRDWPRTCGGGDGPEIGACPAGRSRNSAGKHAARRQNPLPDCMCVGLQADDPFRPWCANAGQDRQYVGMGKDGANRVDSGGRLIVKQETI